MGTLYLILLNEKVQPTHIRILLLLKLLVGRVLANQCLEVPCHLFEPTEFQSHVQQVVRSELESPKH